MTQPTERRFVMEPRLDAEVATLNTAISAEATARANADSAESSARIAGDALKVAKAGDTMTGALVLPGNPTSNLQAAPKQYVDAGDAALQTSINDVKQTSRVYVKNGASSLTKGTPVYITGADGTNVIIGAASNASEATSSKVIGLTETDLTANAMGYVVTDGKLTNIDTSGAAAAGDAVWLGVNGAKLYGLANKPVAPAHMVYLGVVSRKNANTGEIEVKVQNGFELDELHNVLISSPANGQALTYDSATQLWKNATPASTLDALTDVTINSGTLAGGQVIKYDAGTTQWVNGAAAGGVTAAATAPNLATSAAGDAWFDTNDGTLYVCYVDVDSTKQWVQVQANSALEASILSRLGALEASALAFGTPSINYLINGGKDIWQRGTSSTGSSGTSFGADRWSHFRASGTAGITVTRQTAGLTGIDYCSRIQRDSGNTSTAAFYLAQNLELVTCTPLQGKVVTFSFYARSGANYSAASSLLRATIETRNGTEASYWNAGDGAGTTIQATTNATLTTTWQRFTVTATVPSTATQVFPALKFIPVGTAGANDYFEITGLQLETGSTATTFRRNQPNIQAELAACQRYYFRSPSATGGAYGTLGTGLAANTTEAYIHLAHPVTMRVPPTSIEVSNLLLWNGAATPTIFTMTLYSTQTTTNMTCARITSNSLTGQTIYFVIQGNNSAGYWAASAEL